MRQYLQKIGLRLAILAVIWVIFTQLLPKHYYLGPEYARWEMVFGEIAELKASRSPVNLVIGDSRPEMGLASRHLRATNLGLGGTSPVEGYYVLQQLKDVPIDTLYLSYSPLHFHGQDCFYNRSVYFGFIDQAYLDDVQVRIAQSGGGIYNWRNWAWLDDLDKNFPLPWVQRQIRYLPALHNIDNYRWYVRDFPAMRARMEENNMSYLFASDICPSDTTVQEYYVEQKLGGFSPNIVNAYYFDAMLKEIARRKIHLVWINMPLNQAVRQPSKRYYQDFETWLQQQLPVGVPYYPLGFQDSCDFKDYSHLDEMAANAFGVRISQWLDLQNTLAAPPSSREGAGE